LGEDFPEEVKSHAGRFLIIISLSFVEGRLYHRDKYPASVSLKGAGI
jgi:hypothetical protein